MPHSEHIILDHSKTTGLYDTQAKGVATGALQYSEGLITNDFSTAHEKPVEPTLRKMQAKKSKRAVEKGTTGPDVAESELEAPVPEAVEGGKKKKGGRKAKQEKFPLGKIDISAEPIETQARVKSGATANTGGRKAAAAANPWLKHVADFRAKNPEMKYKNVLVKAKETYKK